jgi:pantoate--beta-alanine ligase
MQLFIKVSTVKKRLNFLRKSGKSIGFVPTMGALHQGHLSLIEASKKDNDHTVVSIFVNPTQFNNKSDLLKYPRTRLSDIAKLKSIETDILFYPSEKEIYPFSNPEPEKIKLDGLDNIWEGEFRPGHFAGVVQVVKRLLEIVEPHNLYMGQKDFQQFTIIRKMLNKIESKVNLIVVPTMRESDGLAMSSRNMRLSDVMREKSVIISKMLNFAKESYKKIPVKEIEKTGSEKISEAGLVPEYFRIVSIENLKGIEEFPTHGAVAIVAAWAGDVRLIDNMIFNQ